MILALNKWSKVVIFQLVNCLPEENPPTKGSHEFNWDPLSTQVKAQAATLLTQIHEALQDRWPRDI